MKLRKHSIISDITIRVSSNILTSSSNPAKDRKSENSIIQLMRLGASSSCGRAVWTQGNEAFIV